MQKLKLAPSTVPYYTMTLPVSKTVVKYRPFLVKEEKILLIALQSGNPNHVIDAVRNMVLSCTDGKLDTRKIPAADSNYAMLQIRAKSIGEEIKPTIKCSGCEGKTPVRISAPQVLDLQNLASKIQLQLEKQLDPAIRYALVQGGNDLNSIHQAPLHKVWVGSNQKSSLDIPQLNSSYLAIRWVDSYGRVIQSQVLQLTKPSRP